LKKDTCSPVIFCVWVWAAVPDDQVLTLCVSFGLIKANWDQPEEERRCALGHLVVTRRRTRPSHNDYRRKLELEKNVKTRRVHLVEIELTQPATKAASVNELSLESHSASSTEFRAYV
jgi:hypothetical protein